MALSLLAATNPHQKPLDLQQVLEPFTLLQPQLQQNLHLQQQQQQQFFDYNTFPQFEEIHNNGVKTPYKTNFSMEYNNSDVIHHYQHTANTSNNSNHNNNNNTKYINDHINQQNLNNSSRPFISGYHHQHIGADYEQVINFVDSPPNSEESWTDEHSKGSPGPQIIDVQTIFSQGNSNIGGTRKRRMDWDSLELDQSGGNTTETTQSTEDAIASKIPHHEKEKHKREKVTAGRPSWAEDIGFDLNAEFNTNSYLNNEAFFAPVLTTLKQEPHSEPLKVNKSILKDVDKTVVPSSLSLGHEKNRDKCKTDAAVCRCGSPKELGTQEYESIGEKHGNENRLPGPVLQQLNLEDASKIERLSSQLATSTSHADEHKFQYILAAATSTATKNNEETLTYLNQGQSYEIKLKKIGDLSFYRDKILKSVIKICFHERRLQFMQTEQMQQWQVARPGERIIEVDVPLSYGLCHVAQPLNQMPLNTVEVFWDPLKEVGVYVKVNCISTEFTPKKHGGEKGVPFRLQIETYIESNNSVASGNGSTIAPTIPTQATISTAATAAAQTSPNATPGNLTPNHTSGSNSTNINNNNNNNSNNNNNGVVGKPPVHAAACQIKVFKLKGADRKHKQDREKIQKRPQSEQDKFQPSYECTIMNDLPLELITSTPTPGCFSPEYMKIWPNSPVHIPKYDGILSYPNGSPAANASPIANNNVTSTNSANPKLMDANMVSPQHVPDMDEYIINIMPDSTPAQVTQWLTSHRLTSYLSTFAHFSGSDIMRMSKEDLIQICGLADGIRMFNILRAKAIAPRLTLYVSLDNNSYNAIYLLSNTSKELMSKLFKLPGFYELIASGGNAVDQNGQGLYSNWNMHSKYSGSGSNIFSDVCKSFIYLYGPSGVHVTVTDEVLNNEIKDGSLYALEVQNGKVVMKLINKNE